MKSIYDEFHDEATVLRDYEDVPVKTPEIGVRFSVSETPLEWATFLNDVVGDHAVEPYHQYGKYYKSTLVVRVINKEPQQGGVNTAMRDVEDLERRLRILIRKHWPSILHDNGAFLVRRSDIIPSNVSFMIGKQRFPAKALKLEIAYLDMWDYVPAEEERAGIAVDVTITEEKGD